MEITKKRLADVLEKHKKWRRNEDGGARAYLQGMDISHANLFGANLPDADLSNADLSDASLEFAKLSPRYLGKANFSQTDLMRWLNG